MKKAKFCSLIAKIGKISAVKASGTASGFGTYQPKEPECLKKISKQK